MLSTEGVKTLEFRRADSLTETEDQIREIDQLRGARKVRALVASHYSRDVLTDVWSAVALGTFFSKAEQPVAVAWGYSPQHPFDARKFALSPPGLVATALGGQLLREGSDHPENTSDVIKWIETELEGYVSDAKGSERVIVEFDDKRALRLSGRSGNKQHIDRRAFHDTVLSIRRDLEIWFRRTGASPARTLHDQSLESLTEFIKELFENAYQHGRRPDEAGRTNPSLRFIRFRKIVGDPRLLYRRAGESTPILQSFVSDSLAHKRESGFLEICISDFGRGILDTFLATPAGKSHQSRERHQVLDQLLYENLTSNSLDPAAGHGINNAMLAARRLRSFVSLRTNEFWLARSFASDAAAQHLADVSTQPLGKVSGTHWQFIWAPPPP